MPLTSGANLTGSWPDAAAQDRDLSLQLGRRLDWRFLLPDPSLDCVAYFGPEGNTLQRAIRAFSVRLEAFGPSSQAPLREDFSVAVVASARLVDFETAFRVLAPGGMLYAEIGRRGLRTLFRTISLWPLQAPGQCVAAIERVGFRDLETYWERPGFENCREILPLDSVAALEWAWTAHGAHTLRPWLLMAGRWLIKKGLVPRMASSIAVVGRKPYRT